MGLAVPPGAPPETSAPPTIVAGVDRLVLVDERGRFWRVDAPRTHRERAAGLRRRSGLASDEALMIPRCRSVHTIGMRFAITVAFLDRDLRVLRVRRARPGRFLVGPRRTCCVLELSIGADVRPGGRFVRRYTLSAAPRDVR
jgi:uncharacterized membrane protein (UPF0127 family)